MTTAEKTSPEEHSRSTTAVQGQSAGDALEMAYTRAWQTSAHRPSRWDRPGPKAVIVFEKNSADTAVTQTDIKNKDTHLLNS